MVTGGKRYSVKEFAKMCGLSCEYVRQCCRSKPDRCKLKNGWQAEFDPEARRWFIFERIAEESTEERHRTAFTELLNCWNNLEEEEEEEELVWDCSGKSESGNFDLDAAGFFLSLSKLYLTAKLTRSGRPIKVGIDINPQGKFEFAVDSWTIEPFLIDLFEFRGRHRTLLKIWRCIFGLSTRIGGEEFSPCSPEAKEHFLQQFHIFKICLNCGLPITDWKRRNLRIYCNTDCGGKFRIWWRKAMSKTKEQQLRMICRKLRKLKGKKI